MRQTASESLGKLEGRCGGAIRVRALAPAVAVAVQVGARSLWRAAKPGMCSLPPQPKCPRRPIPACFQLEPDVRSVWRVKWLWRNVYSGTVEYTKEIYN